MPNFPWSSRRGGSTIEDTSLAALLAGTELPADGATGLQPVADVLAALQAAPASDELTGEAAALAEFRQQIGVSIHPRESRRRRPTLLSTLLTAKGAAAAAIAAVSLSGAAAAATGNLPAPLQTFAHNTFGAPAAQSSHASGSHGSPVGPNATGPAQHGLCTAYEHAKTHGSAAFKNSVAFKNLVSAAGSADNVDAFCQGTTGSPAPSSSAESANSQANSHPTGAPASGSGDGASSAPTSHPTGKPTSTP
jgi:hypothetical protein